MEDDMIPDDPVQHTVPKPANIMSPIMENPVEYNFNEESKFSYKLTKDNLDVISMSYHNDSPSTPTESDLSEFDSSDDQEDFEVWSSDNTSAENSSDEFNQKQNKCDSEPNEYWRFIRQEKIQKFPFIGSPHIIKFNDKDNFSPLECFSLIVTDDLINLMVTQTNNYARSKFISPEKHKVFLERWVDVTVTEMKKFLGLMMFMNTIRSPGLTFYWSGSSDTGNGLAGRIMKESRFRHILAHWNFGGERGSGYHKIKKVFDILNLTFRKYKEPGEYLYIGKEIIYLRDIYAFQKQILDIPDPKRGLRILRLIDGGMYTYKISILPPDTIKSRRETTKRIILDLLGEYLNSGRKVAFHDIYISLDLARDLLENKTHVLGRIRKNCKDTPRELNRKRLDVEEAKGFQNPDGISVVKYKTIAKSRVKSGYALSSFHGRETIPTARLVLGARNLFVKNQAKILSDLNKCDQIFESVDEFSYCDSPLNNQTTWYRRIAHELLTGVCVINAYCLYKRLNSHRTKFNKFHTQLWRELVGFQCFHDDSYSSDDTFFDEEE